MTTLHGLSGLKDYEGQDLGAGPFLAITQEMIDAFARLTGDHQWIHVDADRARTGPFGTTIAHGYLTLSLLPQLTDGIYLVDGFAMAINYGLNRVRFPAPVPSGSRVQASVRLNRVEEIEGGAEAEFRITVTAVGTDKPSCVADYVGRYYS